MPLSRLYKQAQNLLGSNSLAGTIGTSAGVFLIRFGGAVANFAFSYILARNFPESDVGFIFLVMSLAMLAALFTTMNMENGAVRHLLHPFARGDKAEAAGFIHYVRRILVFAAPLVMVIFVAVLFANQYFKNELTAPEAWGIVAAAATIPCLAMLRLGSRSGHALAAILKSMLSNALIRPVLLCAFTGVFLFWGMAPSVDRILVISLFACFAALIAQHFLLKKTFAFTKDLTPDLTNSNTWLKTGLYLSVTVMLLEYFQNVVVVTASLGLDDGDVAHLNIALRFIGFLRMGLMAVNMAVSPAVSRALAQENEGRAQWLLSMSTQLKFWPTVLVTALVWWLAPFMVGIFGEDYVKAAWALRIFSILPLVAAFFGPSIMLLNVLGRQKDIFRVSAVTFALIVLSIPLAGATYGINGAALAAVGAVFFWEWALFQKVRHVTPVNASLIKALFPQAFKSSQKTAPVSPSAE